MVNMICVARNVIHKIELWNILINEHWEILLSFNKYNTSINRRSSKQLFEDQSHLTRGTNMDNTRFTINYH